MLVVTRAALRALVQRRCRIVNHLNAHPTADLNTDLDDAYRETRMTVTQSKWNTFLTTTGELTLPIVAATNENFAAIPVPTDALILRKLEIRFGLAVTDLWQPVTEVPLDVFRACASGAYGAGYDRRWCLIDSGTNATQTANSGAAVAGVIAMLPLPTRGTYQLWYLREFPATSAESGTSGCYYYADQTQKDLHLYLACAKILISDNDSDGMLGGIFKQVERLEGKLLSGAPLNVGPRTLQRARNYRSR